MEKEKCSKCGNTHRSLFFYYMCGSKFTQEEQEKMWKMKKDRVNALVNHIVGRYKANHPK